MEKNHKLCFADIPGLVCIRDKGHEGHHSFVSARLVTLVFEPAESK